MEGASLGNDDDLGSDTEHRHVLEAVRYESQDQKENHSEQ